MYDLILSEITSVALIPRNTKSSNPLILKIREIVEIHKIKFSTNITGDKRGWSYKCDDELRLILRDITSYVENLETKNKQPSNKRKIITTIKDYAKQYKLPIRVVDNYTQGWMFKSDDILEQIIIDMQEYVSANNLKSVDELRTESKVSSYDKPLHQEVRHFLKKYKLNTANTSIPRYVAHWSTKSDDYITKMLEELQQYVIDNNIKPRPSMA